MNPRRWLPFLGFLIVLGALLRVPLLVALSSMLAVVIGVASWWRVHALDGVIYRRKPYYTRAFPDERVALQVEVENRKLLPISWLQVRDPWHQAVGPEDESLLAPTHIPEEGQLTNIFSLRWYERARRNYTLLFRERGVYEVGPARLTSGDLFGMYDQSRTEGEAERLVVFPKIVPVEQPELRTDDPFGDLRARRRLYEDPNLPMGVRDYRPEDEFRRVHWPATARTGELQAKVYQPVTARVMMVCLNVATFVRHWEGTDPELLEHMVSVAASLVYQGMEDGYCVGLISNGCFTNSDQPFSIQPSRSPRQLAHLLEALAGVTSIVTGAFDRFLLREVPRIPYGASLVTLTSVTPPELMETLVRLKQRGRRLTLISFGRRPPDDIPGVQIIHRPFQSAPRPTESAT